MTEHKDSQVVSLDDYKNRLAEAVENSQVIPLDDYRNKLAEAVESLEKSGWLKDGNKRVAKSLLHYARDMFPIVLAPSERYTQSISLYASMCACIKGASRQSVVLEATAIGAGPPIYETYGVLSSCAWKDCRKAVSKHAMEVLGALYREIPQADRKILFVLAEVGLSVCTHPPIFLHLQRPHTTLRDWSATECTEHYIETPAKR